MRFLKPTKLGVSSDSWLRQVVRVSECVAKTWRYLLSLLRVRLWAVPLVGFESLPFWWRPFPRCVVERAAGVSIPVEDAWVRVAMAANDRRDRGWSRMFINQM